MGRRPCAFKEADIRRALRAVAAAGQPVRGVRFDKDGFTVVIGEPTEVVTPDKADDVENWIGKNAH